MQQDFDPCLLSLEVRLAHDFQAASQVARRVLRPDEMLDVKHPELDQSNPRQDLPQDRGDALAQW